jgi:hypothetical protein
MACGKDRFFADFDPTAPAWRFVIGRENGGLGTIG